MSGSHGLCPECLSRVLPGWSVCKFCGHNLVGVVPAPWQEPEQPPSPSRGAGAVSDNSSFFELYGDFDTTTPTDEPLGLPSGAPDPDEQLALPAGPAPSGGAIPDVDPYDLPYESSAATSWDVDPSSAAAAPVAPSLFGGRESLPPDAPDSSTFGGDGSPADESWWMQPPDGGGAPGTPSEASQPSGPTDAPPQSEPAPWPTAAASPISNEPSFAPSSWQQQDPAQALSHLEAPGAGLPPASKPPLLSREFRLLAMAIVLVLVVLVGLLALDKRDKATYPAAWDTRVAALARFAATDRSQSFTHVVAVQFLSGSEYAEQVRTEAKRYEPDADQLERRQAAFRALGLVATPAPGSLTNRPDLDGPAFYSFSDKQLYVRGSQVSPKTAAVVVHQLSHALADQHYSLSGLRPGSLEAGELWAIVEGDGAVMEADYVAQLSEAERAAYDADRTKLPTPQPSTLTEVRAEAPTMFGTLFGRVLSSAKGTAALDQVLQFPPSSDAQIFDPFRYLDGDRALFVDAPVPPDDAKDRVVGSFGALELYLVLANRIDPLVALSAADAWAGDAMLTYRNGSDAVCADLRIRGGADTDRTVLEHALKQYAATFEDGRVKVTSDAGVLQVRSCDPGKSATVRDRSGKVVLVPLLRTRIAVDLYDHVKTIPNGVNGPILSPVQTRCVAQLVLDGLPAERLLALQSEPLKGAELQALTDAASPQCKAASTPSTPPS